MENLIRGKVIHGLENGRRIGYRTANIALTEGNCPQNGVYAAQIMIASKIYDGMLYVGKRPSLQLTQLSIEFHIFDFSQDIYNQNVTITIIQKIRDEVKFDSLEKLVAQIRQDEMQIKAVLSQSFN